MLTLTHVSILHSHLLTQEAQLGLQVGEGEGHHSREGCAQLHAVLGLQAHGMQQLCLHMPV